MDEKIIQNDLKKQNKLCETLRNRIFRDEIEGNFSYENIEILKKLYLFEGLAFKENFMCCIPLAELTDIICGTAYLAGKIQSAKIIGNSNTYFVNLRLFEILLSLITKYTQGKIKIQITKNSFSVAMNKMPESIYLNTVLKHMNAFKLENCKDASAKIIIPIECKTGSKMRLKSEAYYLFDKYSVFNVY